MPQDFALNTTLARNSPSDEDDVFNTKTLLNRVGYYDEPSYGITPYPDGRLFQSIARFQKDHELAVDGWMKPGGETERALRLVERRGRPGLIDSDFGFPSAGDFDLYGEVGKGHESRGPDVMMAKRATGALGYYPKRLLLDPTDIVDRELHNGITKFQLDNKLYSDGWMGPGGETANAVRDGLQKREDRVRPFNPLLDVSTDELRSDAGGEVAERDKVPAAGGGAEGPGFREPKAPERSAPGELIGGAGSDSLAQIPAEKQLPNTITNIQAKPPETLAPDLEAARARDKLDPRWPEAIANKETNGQPHDGWGTTRTDEDGNPAYGRYQLTPAALKDVGLLDAKGNWTGKYGISSKEDFLNNPEAQKAALGDYIEKYIGKHADKIGTEIKGVRGTINVTEAGLAAALHRGGPGHVRDYFDWVSKKGMNSGDNQAEMLPWHRKVETRLREFERVPLRR